jgi:hypothetical protein
MKQIRNVDIWARTGQPLKNVPIQRVNKANVAFGAVLDFSAIPIPIQTDLALVSLLQRDDYFLSPA